MMTPEEKTAATNDLVAVIWPLLDEGATHAEVLIIAMSALSSWTPKARGKG